MCFSASFINNKKFTAPDSALWSFLSAIFYNIKTQTFYKKLHEGTDI